MAESNAAAQALKTALGNMTDARYGSSSAARSALDEDLHLCGQLLRPVDGSGIDSHGITKVGIFANMDQLVDLLTKGVDPARAFSTAPLGLKPGQDGALMGAAMGTSSGTAYTHGPFIIISDPGKSLVGNKDGNGIKAVLVNPAVKDLIPTLEKHFPQVPFVRFDKVNDYLFGIGRIDAKQRDTENKAIAGIADALREAGVKALDAPQAEASQLGAHAWKHHAYNATGGKRLSMTLASGDIAAARQQLQAAGVPDEDIVSRDGTRLLVMSGSAQAEAAIRAVAKEKGVDADALLRGR